MSSFTSCCSYPLRTPSLGSELAVAVPPAHMRSPLTPVRSLGEGQALTTGRLSSPSKSAEVIPPRVWTCRGLFIPPCSHGTARFGPAPLRATRLLLAPPV